MRQKVRNNVKTDNELHIFTLFPFKKHYFHYFPTIFSLYFRSTGTNSPLSFILGNTA